MRITVFGATGRTGVPLVRQALGLGFESVARTDVARFILDCIEDGRYVHDLPKVGAAA